MRDRGIYAAAKGRSRPGGRPGAQHGPDGGRRHGLLGGEPPRKGAFLKLLILGVLAVALLIDSILRAFRSNFNFGLLLVWLITAALWVYLLLHRQIDAFCAVGIGRVLKILFFCGCGVFCALLAFVALSGYANRADGSERAVVVLGAGLRGERVTTVLRYRLDAAYDYHLQNPDAVIVVTGGQGRGEDIPEAVAMKRYLVQKGVPEALILEETASTSTEENFLFASRLLAERGIGQDEPIAYVTNAFHCYRAGRYAQLVGFADVAAVPAGINASAVLTCYLREVFAVLYYWVFKSSRSGWIHDLVGTLAIWRQPPG